MKVDKTVINETKYIMAFAIIFSVFMQAVFLIIGKWSVAVLVGNIWGAAVSVLNFFVMGLFVQKAVLQDEKDARQTVKASQSLRFCGIILLTVIAIIMPDNILNPITAVVPLIFPRVAVAFRPYIKKN